MAERDGDERPWISSHTRSEAAIVGRCEFCAWYAVADSHTAMVQRYQDHLRETHPDAWLRA
ncbi:hypothetical protein BRC77_13520 [Halobacteriales archaeon QH_8_64_26]|nr:MAG: hypothetical protein BRC77_13520 [Halobacteriales archaeon QH_8_64_26]